MNMIQLGIEKMLQTINNFCKQQCFFNRPKPLIGAESSHASLNIYISKPLLVMLVLLMAITQQARAEQLPPPKYSSVDGFGVNMVSGQVTTNLSGVSIGGSLGLTHSISSHTSNFLMGGGYYSGLNDSFGGGAKYKLHRKTQGGARDHYLMTVFDSVDSADFEVWANGQYVPQVMGSVSNYEYRPLGDKRHSLVNSGTYLLWTKPDGTVVTFWRGNNSNADTSGLLREIKNPNGFVTSVESSNSGTIYSVRTNTGFQLKYMYELVNDRAASDAVLNNNNRSAAAADSLNWSAKNPKHVVAINNTLEYCPAVGECNLSQQWPKVTFHWPYGMPGVMYLRDESLRVVDMQGLTTIYYTQPFSRGLNLAWFDERTSVDSDVFEPRLVGVKNATTDFGEKTYTYEYEPIVAGKKTGPAEGLGYMNWNMIDPARLKRATGPLGAAPYYINQDTETPVDLLNSSASKPLGGIVWARFSTDDLYPGVLLGLNTTEMLVKLQRGFEGKIEEVSYYGKGREKYDYDARGNVTRITRYIGPGLDASSDIIKEANYPSSCTSLTRKTCNQALWIRDAKGYQTDYTYHAESGQIATITLPPNPQGIRAQTRYTYEQKYAYYKIDSQTVRRAASPIWLLTQESYCQKGDAAANGCVNAGDEVVTTYDYGPINQANNLLLRGVVVTADGEARRTCYEYDQYGHQIGKIQPNAALASCY